MKSYEYTMLIVPVGKVLYIVKTGEWRYQKPERDHEKCKKCGACLIFCPVGCVYVKDGKYETNLEYCKGCGICAQECKAAAILMVEEDKND